MAALKVIFAKEIVICLIIESSRKKNSTREGGV